MKIDVRQHKYFQPNDWEEENPKSNNFVYKIPPKGTPTTEMLQSDPPKYRINGQIIEVPEEVSPEEYYERYIGGLIYKEDEEEDIDPEFSQAPKGPYRDINPGFSKEEREEPFEELHPLRKQYLESRLKDIDYQERQQSMQDDFTTRMYGKKDYSQERNNIMKELMEGKQSIDHSHPSYEYNREQLWKDIHLREERDKANGGRFETATLEEWKAKDEEYRQTQPSHCNTALGTLLKEKGIDLPANKSMNDIIKFMDNSSEWKKLSRTEGGHLDHKTANDLAKEGHTVVFGYNNPEGHGHGGVLTGNPQLSKSGNFQDDNGKDAFVPEVKGSLGTKEISTGHLGNHLAKGKEANTEYYVYTGNQDTQQHETQKNE